MAAPVQNNATTAAPVAAKAKVRTKGPKGGAAIATVSPAGVAYYGPNWPYPFPPPPHEGFFTRISHKLHPGWSRLCARVVSGGLVYPQDAVDVLVPRPR